MGAGCYGPLVGRDQRCLGHSKRTVRSGPLQDGGAGPALTVGRHDAFTAAGQQSRLLSSGSQKAYLANKVSAVDASESTDQKHCRQNLETQLIHLRPRGWTSQVSWGPALRCSVQLQPAWRVCGMWPLWRSAAPQTHVGVLTPGTSECDRTWRQSLYIGDEVKMKLKCRGDSHTARLASSEGEARTQTHAEGRPGEDGGRNGRPRAEPADISVLDFPPPEPGERKCVFKPLSLRRFEMSALANQHTKSLGSDILEAPHQL